MGARVSFVVPGPPGWKERLRLDRRNLRLYTPTRTLDHEARVARLARPHFPAPLSGPLRLVIVAVFTPAPSHSKVKRAAMMGQPHLGKPDLSNIAKAVEDALNGVAYKDDSALFEVLGRKVWGEVAETRVTVEAL